MQSNRLNKGLRGRKKELVPASYNGSLSHLARRKESKEPRKGSVFFIIVIITVVMTIKPLAHSFS